MVRGEGAVCATPPGPSCAFQAPLHRNRLCKTLAKPANFSRNQLWGAGQGERGSTPPGALDAYALRTWATAETGVEAPAA